MKKIHTILVVAALAVFPLMFTSCDDKYIEDYHPRYWSQNQGHSSDRILLMAQTLRGHWEGNIQAQGYEDGVLVTQNLFTEIEFDQYDMLKPSGRGIQSDYDSKYAQQAQLVRKFSWEIDPGTGNIIIVYDQGGFKMTIRYDDLKLNESGFSGVMYGDNDTEKFSFSRYSLSKKAVFEYEEEDSLSH